LYVLSGFSVLVCLCACVYYLIGEIMFICFRLRLLALIS
jgi:hypothetical protein